MADIDHALNGPRGKARRWSEVATDVTIPGVVLYGPSGVAFTPLAEDSAHVTGDVGIQMLAVRTDTPINRSGTDGDYEPLQVSAGRLHVNASQIAGVTPTLGDVNNVATMAGALNALPIGRYDATPPTLTAGRFNALQVGSTGSLIVANQSLATALVDAFSNTATRFANAAGTEAITPTFGYGYNGATWDRVRTGDVNNVAAATGFRDALAVGRYNATLPTITDTRYNAVQLGSRGGLHVNLLDVNGVGTLFPTTAAAADAYANPTITHVGADLMTYNGTTWDRLRSAINATNTIGTGIVAAGLLAQFDDTAPTTITENQFGNLRMSVDRRLYVEGNYTLGRATADTQIKGSAGFARAISIAPTSATPTAGLLTVYDSLTETGTIIFAEWITTSVVGHTVILDIAFATGLFVSFDAALAAVQVTVAYR